MFLKPRVVSMYTETWNGFHSISEGNSIFLIICSESSMTTAPPTLLTNLAIYLEEVEMAKAVISIWIDQTLTGTFTFLEQNVGTVYPLIYVICQTSVNSAALTKSNFSYLSRQIPIILWITRLINFTHQWLVSTIQPPQIWPKAICKKFNPCHIMNNLNYHLNRQASIKLIIVLPIGIYL